MAKGCGVALILNPLMDSSEYGDHPVYVRTVNRTYMGRRGGVGSQYTLFVSESPKTDHCFNGFFRVC